MLKSIIIGVLLTLPFSTSQAMWAKADPKIIIQNSALIIEAELVHSFTTDINHQPTTLGLLSIKGYYKGMANQPLITIQLPNRSSSILSTDIHYKIGTSGLWLLNLNSKGLLSANHPQRFISMDKASATLELLESPLKESTLNIEQ